MNKTNRSAMKTVLGGVGALVLVVFAFGLVFGAITLGIRIFGGESAYDLWLFRNSLKTGDYITHHDNGEVSSIQPYSKGKANGEARFFDNEGNLTESFTYSSGITSGPYALYYPDGAVKEKGTYHLGSKTDGFPRYDQQGNELDP
ncbi:MAG: toxin-antitoxin system YwqK family antitoxin [Mariniblastus sp.]